MKRSMGLWGKHGLFSLLMLLFIFSLLVGCNFKVGVFLDSAVSGLDYYKTDSTGAKCSPDARTSAEGQFVYKSGDTVTFAIGKLVLGSAAGDATLTPLSITSGAASASDQRVTNMLILLQTLDADGDLNNGIQITDGIRAIVSANAGSVNFDQAPAAFRTSLAPLMTALNSSSPAVFTDAFYRGVRTVKTADAALQHFALSTQTTRVTVETRSGKIRGYELNSSTWRWLGVPYAKPPVGDLRWKEPQRPEPWFGIREAIEWGDQAPQPAAYTAYGLGGVSEDCLTLNITAPKDARRLPVMVWFHGGAFGILTGNTESYNNAASLPSKGVILVTVNHRLGAFGYMAHPALTAEQNGHSGNYGQMDLIKALEWIKANIAGFGGDPHNVTIFGQSGGGGKAALLMSSPLAKHLFHKVICESGIADPANTVLNPSSQAAAEAKGANLFGRLGVTSLAEARAIPWSAIINMDLATYKALAWLVYTPNVDGYFMPDTVANILQKRLENDVPFMVGANSADFIAGADLAKGIPAQMPLRAANNHAPQYVYRWSYVPAGWAYKGVGAYHGLELVYVFNYPASFVTHYLMGLPLVNGTTPLDIGVSPASPYYLAFILSSTGYYTGFPPLTATAESTTLTDNVMTVWTNFAKYGTPGAPGVIDWPVYTTNSDAYVEIGAGGSFTAKQGIATAF